MQIFRYGRYLELDYPSPVSDALVDIEGLLRGHVVLEVDVAEHIVLRGGEYGGGVELRAHHVVVRVLLHDAREELLHGEPLGVLHGRAHDHEVAGRRAPGTLKILYN